MSQSQKDFSILKKKVAKSKQRAAVLGKIKIK